MTNNYVNIYNYINDNNIERIYVDFDETLVNSIDSVLLQLNKRFNTNFETSMVNTWNFSNCFPNITSIEIEEIFDSVEFFDTVSWKDGAIDFVEKYKDIITIVTCGNAMNLYLKEKFIRNVFPNIDFIGLESTVADKSSVNMGLRTLMIDDNQNNLYSVNAQHRILFENISNTDWNNRWKDGTFRCNIMDGLFIGEIYPLYYRTMKAWI